MYVSIVAAGTEDTEPPTIKLLADKEEDKAFIAQSWRQFNVTACKCYDPADHAKIMAAINNYPGGTGAFSTSVRDISNGLQDSVEDGVAVRPTIIGRFFPVDVPVSTTDM